MSYNIKELNNGYLRDALSIGKYSYTNTLKKPQIRQCCGNGCCALGKQRNHQIKFYR